MYSTELNKFIFCSQYVSVSNRGIRDKNRIILKKLKSIKEEVSEERDHLLEELIINNRPLVWFIVKNYAKSHYWINEELEDVVGQGYLYLCEICKNGFWNDAKISTVGYFGVGLYYRLLGKLEGFIKRREERSPILEFPGEIDASVEDPPEIITSSKMEVDYIFHNMSKILYQREIHIVMTLYEVFKKGGNVSDALRLLEGDYDLSTERLRQILMRAFRRIKSNYKPILWDAFED